MSFLYICFILIKAFLKKTEESEYLLVTVTAFMCYGVLLGLDFLFEVQVEKFSFLMYFGMVIGFSLLMMQRSQRTINKVEELSKELLTYDRLKDEFLAKTSHELGTPLHGIINLSKSLMEGVEGPLKKRQQESVILIHNVGKRLASLVEDLLFESKIKQGEIRTSPRPINIHVVKEVLAEMSYLIPKEQSVKLVNNVPENLPLIFMDEQKLKQVFFNLIYNAIKYTKRGSITILAEVRDQHMQVSITDTGAGIEEEHFDLLFSSFYQVESSKSGESEGLGLGLSITKNIVEGSGGSIWVTSKVGEGSTFTFTIPLANEHQLMELKAKGRMEQIPQLSKAVPKIESLLPQKIDGTKPYTILVVDDEPANLKVLINIIQSLEYSVIAVSSGCEALEMMKNEKIDLLIIDLMMPKMSGYEVCENVRKLHDLVELPIIILTATSQLSDLVVSFQAGANDFLQKPVDMKELKVRIESLLLMKKSAQEALNNELSYFYAQITPHFLYNTLNTIIGLSYKDEEKTREALQHLATYFRAKLDFKSHHTLIPIEDELELVKAYLSIEKMRFGDRLKVEYEIDETIEIVIPSLTLQPLLENAVQHGISKMKRGGTLLLTIEREISTIKITIEDNGVGIPKEKQQELLSGKNERIGFNNPFKKLTLLKDASFQLDSEEGRGTKITIRLPEV